MTHEHNAVTQSPHIIAPENPPTVEPTPSAKPAIEYSIQEFQEGDWKGFKFVTPEYNSMEQLIADYGADKVLSLVNTQIDSRIRTKVKNALKSYAILTPSDRAKKQAELVALNQGVLFNQAEATSWRPEVRELGPNQLFKKAKDVFAAMQKESDPAKKMALMQEGQALLIEAGKALAA